MRVAERLVMNSQGVVTCEVLVTSSTSQSRTFACTLPLEALQPNCKCCSCVIRRRREAGGGPHWELLPHTQTTPNNSPPTLHNNNNSKSCSCIDMLAHISIAASNCLCDCCRRTSFWGDTFFRISNVTLLFKLMF